MLSARAKRNKQHTHGVFSKFRKFPVSAIMDGSDGLAGSSHKGHHKAKSGRGQKAAAAKKKLAKVTDLSAEDARKRNPKAFAIQNVGKTERRVRRKEDIGEKRKRLPQVDRAPIQPPPYVVAVVGPPKVKKKTRI